MEEILTWANPEAKAVELFDSLGMQHRFGIKGEPQSQTSPTCMFRPLCPPCHSPQRLEDHPEVLVEVGLWSRLPSAWSEMMSSPRYFPGREVLVQVLSEVLWTASVEITFRGSIWILS